MKNKLYIISSVIICLSIALCACGNGKNEQETTTPETTTVSQTVTVDTLAQTVTYTDSSGYHVVSIIEPSTQERTHPPVPSRTKSETNNVVSIPYSSGAPNTPVTLPKVDRPTSPTQIHYPDQPTVDFNVTIPEKSNGLSVQFKSNPVKKGNDATIAINGEAGKQYTIEVYRNEKDLLSSDKLKLQTANASGIVSWTFDTDNCNVGYCKIIIRETNSDKYIQTSIIVLN